MSLFDNAKKPEKPKLDLSGLPTSVPSLPPDKERKAIEKGEELGYRSREPVEPPPVIPAPPETATVRRRKKTAPQSKLFVTGPKSVLDRFVNYTNTLGVSAYWEALDQLLKDKGI